MEAVTTNSSVAEPSGSAVSDAKRREFCNNGRKIRRECLLQSQEYANLTSMQDTEINKFKGKQVINPFSLAKLSFINCSDEDKEEYYFKEVPKIDDKTCCYSLKNRSSDVMYQALENKHLECFKHGHKMGFKMPFYICYSALAHECIEILKYALENGADFVLQLAFEEAGVNGHLPCFKYLHQVGGQLTENVMKAVVSHGNLDCLKYLLENNCEWTDEMCALSTNSGDLDFVRFCQDNGCPWIVEYSLDWFLMFSNYSIIMKRGDKESADWGTAVANCRKYILSTAKVVFIKEIIDFDLKIVTIH